MRRLILAAIAPSLLTPILLAQDAHYESGVLIAPTIQETTIRLPRHPESIPTLTFSGQDGRTKPSSQHTQLYWVRRGFYGSGIKPYGDSDITATLIRLLFSCGSDPVLFEDAAADYPK